MATPANALTAGLTGTITVNSSAADHSWGRLAASAITGATKVGDASMAVDFGYDTGAAMVGVTAPARRVGLFLTDATSTTLTSDGWTLVDTAINWATQTITYKRDATNRIIERKENGTTIARYAYRGGSDTPALTLNASNQILEKIIPLPGGVVLTKRAAGDVWSYPNLHGDTVATANAAGSKTGATFKYDPYGNALAGLPDNAQGDYDYGWLGQHQRGLEHAPGLQPIIEMGARQYSPLLGRFLETDPVEGGSANDYDYGSGDPVNGLDLAGTASFVQLKLFALLAFLGGIATKVVPITKPLWMVANSGYSPGQSVSVRGGNHVAPARVEVIAPFVAGGTATVSDNATGTSQDKGASGLGYSIHHHGTYFKFGGTFGEDYDRYFDISFRSVEVASSRVGYDGESGPLSPSPFYYIIYQQVLVTVGYKNLYCPC